MVPDAGFRLMPAALAACCGCPHADCSSGVSLSWLQHDLTDAVAWAIKNKIADPARVAIYGGSYGESSLRSCQRSSEALQRANCCCTFPVAAPICLVGGSGSLAVCSRDYCSPLAVMKASVAVPNCCTREPTCLQVAMLPWLG